MTRRRAPRHDVPPAGALPAPRPAPPAVWSFASSGSPRRGGEERPTDPQPVRDLPRPAPASALNRRDLEVLSHLARGRSTAQIASSLSVSSNTARTRIRRVQSKLDVAGRGAAVQAAQHLGVLAIVPRPGSSD
ncbi:MULTISPECIES: response regulator transcription factor [unclassified Geodermatophilus]|uniref:response regulator transcription factor n=1 Tax=unclassified Geodermatophilus TaxID=2637632 RepID=UPI003F5336CA